LRQNEQRGVRMIATASEVRAARATRPPGVRGHHGRTSDPHCPGYSCTVSDRSDEETGDPLYADDRNKVEKWTRDGTKVERLLYAGNNLAKAEDIFARAIKHRPRIRLTIRQRTRVLQQHSF
jgi:hypothetical protein